MRGNLSPDIEQVLVDYFNSQVSGDSGEVVFSAPPVPADLHQDAVVITRIGGYEQAYVQDVSTVHFDCYSDSEARSAEMAAWLTEMVRSLVGVEMEITFFVSGDTAWTHVYAADIQTLPYFNPDPRHPTLPRYTLSARITTRMLHQS